MGVAARREDTLLERIRHDAQMARREPFRTDRRAFLEHYDEACDAWMAQIRRLWGKNTLGIAQMYEAIAELRLRQGRRKDATRALARAARAWRRGRLSLPSRFRHVEGGIVLDEVRRQEAWCLLKLGRAPEARRLLRLVHGGRNAAMFEDDFRLLAQRYPGALEG